MTDDYQPRDDEIDPQLNDGGKPATDYPDDDAIDPPLEDDATTSPEVPST